MIKHNLRTASLFLVACLVLAGCHAGQSQVSTLPEFTFPTTFQPIIETTMPIATEAAAPIEIESVEYVYAKESYENDKISIKVRNILDEPMKSITLYVAYLNENGDITDSRYPSSNMKIEPGQAIYLEVEFWDGVPYQICLVNGNYSTNTESYKEFYLDKAISYDCLSASQEGFSKKESEQDAQNENHIHILGGWMISSSPDEDTQGTLVQCCTVCNEVMNYKTVDFHIASDKLENPGESIAWKKSADILQTYTNHLPVNLSLSCLTMEDFTIATIYADSGEELASVGFMDEEGNTLTLADDTPVCMLQVMLDKSYIHTDAVDEAIIALMQLCNPLMTEDQALFFFTQLKYDLLYSSQSDENGYTYCETNSVTFVLVEDSNKLLNLFCLFS